MASSKGGRCGISCLQENSANALRQVMMAVGLRLEQPQPQGKLAAGSLGYAAVCGTPRWRLIFRWHSARWRYRPRATISPVKALPRDYQTFFDELVDFILMADGCEPDHPESCPPLASLPDELRSPTPCYRRRAEATTIHWLPKPLPCTMVATTSYFETDFIGALTNLPKM